MSNPPRGRPPAPIPSESPGTPPKPNPPPVAAPRTNVSHGIAKRWPPLANKPDPPVQAQPRSPATSNPPLPSRRSPEQSPKGLPDSPAPPLPKRPAEPLPPLPSTADAAPPLPKRPAEPLPPIPTQRKQSETLPPVPSQVQARATAPSYPTRSPVPDLPVPASPSKSVGTPVFPTRASAPMANGDIDPNSFGKCLQGATEAIGKRHDDELIALESLRFHVFNRAKQDKAYAEELLKTNMRASKKAAMVSNPSSPIFKVRTVCLLLMSKNLCLKIVTCDKAVAVRERLLMLQL